MPKPKSHSQFIPPTSGESSLGAGVIHQGKQYITHSVLPFHLSAMTTLSKWQKWAILVVLGGVFSAFIYNPKAAAIGLVAILTSIYFFDVVFNFFLVFKSLHFPPELDFSPEQIDQIDESKLPVYSILCPLYKEAHVLPQFLAAIAALDWPKDKLEVLLLLEEDDEKTIAAAAGMNLPSYVQTLVVPHSFPKTKPKACNYGLAHVKGEYTVIYDAEDRPDANQLKIAYLGFQASRKNVACLQAKLNYYNPGQNLLTRLFTAEYSLWFDVILPGLQSVNTAIPLGGTSNHFKTGVLRQLQGWDAFNVTEDADLGARLFKAGFTTSIIDSTTLEEANSNWGNWLRQRSRWIKGYIQTFLVHNRHPVEFFKKHKIHALLFQLVVGGKIAFMVINPFLWVITISYFIFRAQLGPVVESLYPAPVFYVGLTSLVFGNFLFMFYYMIGCARRGHWNLIKYVLLIPIYWLAVSVAGFKAVWQLIFKPHYWEKTNHGLHIESKTSISWTNAPVLAMASLGASFISFLYSSYLGRNLSLEEFGLVGLIGSFAYLSQFPVSALSRVVSHKSSYWLGKFNQPANEFRTYLKFKTEKWVIWVTILWCLVSPFLAPMFHSSSWFPFLLFAPVILISPLLAVDTGYLSGNLRFTSLSVMTLVDASIKFLSAILLVNIHLTQFIYAASSLGVLASYLISRQAVEKVNHNLNVESNLNSIKSFPKKLFFSTVLSRIAAAVYLSLDVILARYYLPADQAGLYTIISLVGKMIYFFGSTVSQFITPVIGHTDGQGKDVGKAFAKVFFVSSIAIVGSYLVFGLFASFTAPILFGSHGILAARWMPWYGLSVALTSLAGIIIAYQELRQKYAYSIISLLLLIVPIFGVGIFHKDITQLVMVMLVSSAIYFYIILVLFLLKPAFGKTTSLESNIKDLFNLFSPSTKSYSTGLRILIFNWRDTKHTWAGGAEIYVHELAKRWVKEGNSVTLFCGNDQKSQRNEIVDGVSVVRRGGFFTVYIWAFLYYVFKFRGQFDVVVDSENGVPFFTPLYVSIPKVLLIHHVHQKVFRDQLKFPFSQFASFLEAKAMPFLYRSEKIITVSESSRSDIQNLGLGRQTEISIINPGTEVNKFAKAKKTSYPSVLYLGRIRPYKNVDIAIKAFAQVVKNNINAKLIIAGWGENINELHKLANSLNLNDSVEFLGKISEEHKVELFSKSWVMIQPSSFEGWGITVIEANASGVPVVASRVPGLVDAVQDSHTGYLVSEGDVNSFASRVIELFDNQDLRAQMSENSINWAKNFDWDLSAKLFLMHLGSVSKPRGFRRLISFPDLGQNY